MNLSFYELIIDRREFLDALESIASFQRRSKMGWLKIAFDGQELQLSMPRVAISLAARGTWPSAVWVQATLVWGLAAVPPSGDPVRITLTKGRVRIGATSVAVTSQT